MVTIYDTGGSDRPMLPDMPEVTIRMGSPADIISDEQRASIEHLADDLRQRGHDAGTEIIPYIPGRRGVTWPESVAIFVGSGAATALITLVVSDVYSTVKKWARNRFSKRAHQVNPRPLWITFYGPDNKPLLRLKIDREGEHEEELPGAE